MPVNSSWSIVPPPPLVCLVNSSSYPDIFSCFNERANSVAFAVLTVLCLLLVLPLCSLVAWTAFRQRRRGRSEPTSHTDVFTYYMMVMEVTSAVGVLLSCCGIHACSPEVMVVGYLGVLLAYSGQTLLHCLTCVERYLAVVHPVTYLGLRQSGGVRVRNAAVGCVWLLCFATVGFAAHVFPGFPAGVFFGVFIVVLAIVCFCSLAVFCALLRPGVGSDQSKRRAFHTILAITGVLLVRFSGHGPFIFIVQSMTDGESSNCTKLFCVCWLSLPSSLVLPLLYLHRRGMLTHLAHSCIQRER